jgi:hypothetical protein
MVDKCVHLREFLDEQGLYLKKAIDEDKWYLSEIAHKDVGIDLAKKDFFEHYLKGCAENFRINYCSNKCNDTSQCIAYQGYLKRNGIKEPTQARL